MFQIGLPEGWIIYNMFNEDLLIQCRKPYFKRQYMDLALPLEIINKEKEYKVEEVRNYRKQEYGTQFLVHWKGYKNEHNQQIAETELLHAKEIIEDYWTRILSQNL